MHCDGRHVGAIIYINIHLLLVIPVVKFLDLLRFSLNELVSLGRT
jgi:hypothetical protein